MMTLIGLIIYLFKRYVSSRKRRTNLMNKKIKDKWLTALRSGKYKQGRNFLKDKKLYCCLGVLCDIAEKQQVGKWIIYDGRYEFVCKEDSNAFILPQEVILWSGLHSDNGRLSKDVNLATLNDSGSDFNEIADVIEYQL